MPRLLIVDQQVSAGGVERFLHGLLGGLLELDEFKEWDTTVLLAETNTGGSEVVWPGHLGAPNLEVRFISRRDRLLKRVFDALNNPRRVLGIPGTLKAKRVTVDWLAARFQYQIWGPPPDAAPLVERFCRHREYDVVYFSYPYQMSCPRVSAPLVATPHDFNYRTFGNTDPRLSALLDRQTGQWVRECSRLVVSTDFIAGELASYYPQSSGKVRVVYLGIPESGRVVTDADIDGLKRRLGLPDDFILTVGWLAGHKNQKVIIKALGELKKRGLGTCLVCAGPNSGCFTPGARPEERGQGYIQELLREAERQGVRPGRDVIGLGYVDDFELDCLYRGAGALVVSSLYEAGSFPAREAMRLGCPVVLSRIPPNEEENDRAGGGAWLFEPSDHVQLADVLSGILRSPETARDRAGRARAAVRELYSWKKTAAGYLSAFEEAIGEDRAQCGPGGP